MSGNKAVKSKVELIKENQLVQRFENYNLDSIVTPVNVSVLGRLLSESNYDKMETDFIMEGFTEGFDICYQGPVERQDNSKNIPFTVGDKVDLWNKLMKEVKLGWVAGPYEQVPFKNYTQSPIGLVPQNCQ